MSEKERFLCQEAFDALFDLCDQQKLFNEIRRQHRNTYRFLVSGGFQINVQSLHTHKRRLGVKLPGLGEEALLFADVAQESPGPWNGLHRWLDMIKEDSLDALLPWLLAASSPAIVALALYQFPEGSAQRSQALALLSDSQAWQSDTTPDARLSEDELRSALPGLVQTLSSPSRTDVSVPQDMTEMLLKEYRRGKAEQEQAGAKQRKKVTAELHETQQALRQATEQISQLNKQLIQQQQHMEQRLQQETQRIRQDLQQSHENFLQDTLQVDHQLQSDSITTQLTTERLLKQIADATAAQRDLNQNHGSKDALRKQLKQLEDALQTLQLAADDSFVTVRNLSSIMSQTNAQILSIRKRLQDPDACSLACSQLAAHIAAIPLDQNGDRRLHDADDFVQDALNHELLQDQEASHLQGIIQHRLATLKNLRLKPLEKNLQQMPTGKASRGPAEIWYLSRELPKLKRVTLLLDGYNVMKRSNVWLDMEQNACLEVARKHFIKTIQNKLACFQKIEIVFDGTGTTLTHDTVSDTFRITYSAHINDEHNADDIIVRRAKELKESGQAELIWVVTNDYDIRHQLQDTCQAFVDTSAIPRFFMS